MVPKTNALSIRPQGLEKHANKHVLAAVARCKAQGAPPTSRNRVVAHKCLRIDERRAYAKVRADGLGLKLAIWPATSLPPRTVLSSGAALHFHVGTGVRAVEP